MTVTPQAVADLGYFLDNHTRADEATARAIIRAAAAGKPISLPAATDFAGEVLRGQLSTFFATVEAAIAPMVPDAVAATPAATSTPPPVAASSASEPVPMSVESRRVLFRQMAGPRLQPFADALAESPATFDDGKGLIAAAKLDLPPESRLPPGYVTIEQRAAGQPEMGGSIDFAPSKTEVAKAGWDKAFAKVAGRT